MKTTIRALLLCTAILCPLTPAMARTATQVAAPATVVATASGEAAQPGRVVPLEQGSNFRDLGGYRGFDGKTIRWGKLYRSGGTAMLTDGDVKRVKALGITEIVDLRSNEERRLAPTKLDGINYSAVGYSMAEMIQPGAMPSTEQLYRQLPTTLTPQLRVLFQRLVRNDGATMFNCSAGQDRTGVTAAIVLSALGVSRDDIVKDYLLSTQLRRPQFEMPRIDAAKNADDPVALMFAHWHQPPNDKAGPLYDAGGSYVRYALDEIDKRWGSVDNFLRTEIGVSDADLALIRQSYLQ